MDTLRDEHRWLMQLAGEWTCDSESGMPGQPPQRFSGTDSVRALGDYWIVANGAHETPDGRRASVCMTLGFDVRRGCFCGTFVHSMMSHLWVYEGQLDETRKILTLESTGPALHGTDPLAEARYRDMITLVSDTERTFQAGSLDGEGSWTCFMQSRYRRCAA